MSEVLRKKCCLSPDVHSRDEFISFNETIRFFSFYCAAVIFIRLWLMSSPPAAVRFFDTFLCVEDKEKYDIVCISGKPRSRVLFNLVKTILNKENARWLFNVTLACVSCWICACALSGASLLQTASFTSLKKILLFIVIPAIVCYQPCIFIIWQTIKKI